MHSEMHVQKCKMHHKTRLRLGGACTAASKNLAEEAPTPRIEDCWLTGIGKGQHTVQFIKYFKLELLISIQHIPPKSFKSQMN